MDSEYLKEHVGEALTKALAFVARTKPGNPVEQLGHCLLKFADHQDKWILKRTPESKEDEEPERNASKCNENDGDSKAEETNAESALMDKIGSTDDVAALLPEILEYIRSFSGASSVYIGKKEFRATKLDRAEDGDDATDDNSFVKYVAATSGDEDVLSTYLRSSEGVTFDAWKAVEEDTPEDEEEEEEKEGEEISESVKTKKNVLRPVHIPNVLRDDRVRFFGSVPKFGAFLAVPLKYKSCRNNASIEALLATSSPKESSDESEEAKTTSDEINDDENNSEGDDGGEKKKEVPTDAVEFAASSLPMVDMEMVICLDTLRKNTPGAFDASVVEKVQQISELIARAYERSDIVTVKSDAAIVRSEKENNSSAIARVEEAMSGVEEEIAAAEEAAGDDDVAKRLARARVRLSRTVKSVVALQDDILRYNKLKTTPKSPILRAFLSFLVATGVSVDSVSDLGCEPSWSKMVANISAAKISSVADLDESSVSASTIDFVRKDANDQDLDELRSQSVAASVLLALVKALVEASAARDAKLQADKEAAAEASKSGGDEEEGGDIGE